MIVEVGANNNTVSDFDKTLKKGNVIVLFYANWCGHCQRLMPDWNDMKKILIDNNNYLPEQIIEVESGEQDQKLNYINNNYITDNTKVMPEGYPTIGKIVNGHFDKYYGGRSLNELVQWAKPK